jgi:hypothetical protein
MADGGKECQKNLMKGSRDNAEGLCSTVDFKTWLEGAKGCKRASQHGPFCILCLLEAKA